MGQRTFYFRDVFLTHLPFKAFGQQQLRQGRVPALNPQWALGQPFRGNPNAVAYYPGNVLYLFLPFWIAFNAHYALHWLLAAVTMWALARGLGRSPPAALLAGLTYAGSGWMLSVLTFYNIVTVVAWWPAAMLGAVVGGRRGLSWGGLACGMALLGGEPVIGALAMGPAAVVAISRRGVRRGLLNVVAVGALGLAVALPQAVATWRILGFTFRGGGGALESQASHFTLHLGRLLELVVPFPFGIPGYLGESGLRISSVMPHLPYFYSLHFGVVGLALALTVAARRRWWSGLALLGTVLAWLGGFAGELIASGSLGVLRAPEKLLLWPALLLPLLAAEGLDRVSGEGRPAARWWGAGASLSLATAIAVWLLAPQWAALEAVVQRRLLAGGLLLAALLLAAMAALQRVGEKRLPKVPVAAGLVGLQLLALAQLAPLWLTDSIEPYRTSALATLGASPQASVVAVRQSFPPWRRATTVPSSGPTSVPSSVPPSVPSLLPPGPPAGEARLQAEDLSYSPAALFGARYPLAPDVDGTHHVFYDFLLFRLALAGWPERISWARTVGAEWIASPEPIEDERLELVASGAQRDGEASIYRVRAPAPAAWWPERLEIAGSPRDAFEAVASGNGSTARAVVPQPVEHRPGGEVRLLQAEPDRLVLEVDSEGGLLMVRRAFQALWRAEVGGEAVPVLPANLCLVGVVVPEGRHSVELAVTPGPESAAAWIAIVAAGALLVSGARKARGTEPAGGPRAGSPPAA